TSDAISKRWYPLIPVVRSRPRRVLLTVLLPGVRWAEEAAQQPAGDQRLVGRLRGGGEVAQCEARPVVVLRQVVAVAEELVAHRALGVLGLVAAEPLQLGDDV